jgi:hypothetical protein
MAMPNGFQVLRGDAAVSMMDLLQTLDVSMGAAKARLISDCECGTGCFYGPLSLTLHP